MQTITPNGAIHVKTSTLDTVLSIRPDEVERITAAESGLDESGKVASERGLRVHQVRAEYILAVRDGRSAPRVGTKADITRRFCEVWAAERAA